MRKYLWQALGWVAVALAFLGALLPLLPTTPFLLVAAYAFARSSPRFHRWLIEHRQFGPLLRNWQERGAIDRRSKRLAVLVIGMTFAASVAMGLGWPLLLVQGLVLAAVTVFLLSRPDA